MTYNEASAKVNDLIAHIKTLSKHEELDYQNAYTVGYLTSLLTEMCRKSVVVQDEIDFYLQPVEAA